MLEIWPAIVIGWPAIIASLVCSFIGIKQRKPILLVAGAFLATPFAWYLGIASHFRPLWLLLPLLQLGAAYAVARRRSAAAVMLLVPFSAVAVWLAQAVLRQ